MKVFYSLIAAAMTAACAQCAMAQTVTSVKIGIKSNSGTVGNPVTEGKLAVGGTRTYAAIVEPAEAASLPVTWSVSNPDYAIFDTSVEGKIRGLGAGTTIITAEVGGVKADYTLTVAQKAAKVGDYYFSNGSWESSGIVAGKTCIGVVFYVDPSDENGMTGKIVSLDEADQLQWSLASAGQPGAVSETDGLVNLDAIRSVNGWENAFAAAAWCASKTDGGLQWYLPAIGELRQLFAASCGLTWVASGAAEGTNQINDWTEMNITMRPADPADNTSDKTNPYPASREAFNKKFTNIGATPLNGSGTLRYWSSTQYAEDFAMQLAFEGGYPMSYPRHYIFDQTRAIARFPLDRGTSGIDAPTAAGSPTANVAIRPNPAVSTATIEAGTEMTAVQVYSLIGSLTAAKAAIDGTTATIDVETLAPGTYVVTVATADGSRRSAKLIKR